MLRFIILAGSIVLSASSAYTQENQRPQVINENDNIRVEWQNLANAYTYVRGDTLINYMWWWNKTAYDTVTFVSFVTENENSHCHYTYWYRVINQSNEEFLVQWENVDAAFAGVQPFEFQFYVEPRGVVEFTLNESERDPDLCNDQPEMFNGGVTLFKNQNSLPKLGEFDERVSVRASPSFSIWFAMLGNRIAGWAPSQFVKYRLER